MKVEQPTWLLVLGEQGGVLCPGVPRSSGPDTQLISRLKKSIEILNDPTAGLLLTGTKVPLVCALGWIFQHY